MCVRPAQGRFIHVMRSDMQKAANCCSVIEIVRIGNRSGDVLEELSLLF